MNQTLDKFESHYRGQLSALMDGELAPDEARFMLRRLSHDDELAGCWERWQLCGDVLRGHACAPAPDGFGARVARALAADAAAAPQLLAADGTGGAPRRPWLQWGGGAALAASVAAVAFMIGRGQAPAPAVTPDAPAVVADAPVEASSGPAPAAAPSPAVADPAPVLAAVPAPAPSVVQPAARPRPSAVRRTAPAGPPRAVPGPVAQEPATAVAAAAAPQSDPSAPPSAAASGQAFIPLIPAPAVAAAGTELFGVQAPQARPWPRSVLPQYSASGAFNASVQVDTGARTFYPFEPRSQVLAPPPASVPPGTLPLPPQDPPPEME